MKNCIVLTIIGLVFITCMTLILSNDATTVNCIKCNEVWTVYGLSDEEKTDYVCPDCKMTDKSDTNTTRKKDSSNHYTSPTKGKLHRHMGGTGGLW